MLPGGEEGGGAGGGGGGAAGGSAGRRVVLKCLTCLVEGSYIEAEKKLNGSNKMLPARVEVESKDLIVAKFSSTTPARERLVVPVRIQRTISCSFVTMPGHYRTNS